MRTLLITGLVALAAIALLVPTPAFAQARVGIEPPEITADVWINGEKTSLAENAGRVVLIDFWAQW